MSSWLSFFQSYLNPGKLAAVTVPGIVIALALVLALGPVPCQKPSACPYCSSSLTPVKDATDKAKNTTPVNTQMFIQGAPATLKTELGDAARLDLTAQIKAFNSSLTPPAVKSEERSPLSEVVDPAGSASTGSCLGLPRFIVPSTIGAVNVKDDKAFTNVQQAAQKAALSLYVIDPANGWDPSAQKTEITIGTIRSTDVGTCNTLLSQIKEGIAVDNKALTQFVTQANTDLGTLSSDLITAQNAGETLVEASLHARIRSKRDFIAWAQAEQAQVSNVQSAEQALETRVSPLVTATTTAPTPVSPSPGTAQDLMQVIQDHLIQFLVLALIIGQILDPLQRGAVSFFGPRRDYFIAFNEVYGRKGDGEIRYGDRRLWPWALRNNKSHEDALTAAGRAYSKDPNIYDRDYAIGAGYITQSDAQAIENDWYTQSQLTSGLVLPMVVLSLCLGARAICCSATATGNWEWPTAIILGAMPLAVILGSYLTDIGLHLSSSRYGEVAGGWFRLFSTPKTDRFVWNEERRRNHMPANYQAKRAKMWSHTWWIGLLIIVAVIVGVLGIVAESIGRVPGGLSFPSLAVILSPMVFVIPLWVAGLDRLHKYYSELQARIGGNILRLEATTEQKFFDLLSDKKASCALKAKFDETIDARKRMNCIFEELDCTNLKDDGDPPAGDQDSDPPAPQQANSAQPGNNPAGNQ